MGLPASCLLPMGRSTLPQTIDGLLLLDQSLPGDIQPPFELMTAPIVFLDTYQMGVTYDEIFTCYTNAKTGVLSYLLLEDGGRLLLEQSGYLII